jgi:oxygen-dependent protoporphyrinogen oxidase
MRAAFPRFLELEARYGSVIRGLHHRSSPPDVVAGPSPPPFVALPEGMRGLVTAITDALPADAIHCGVGVDAIDRRPDGYRLRLGDGTHISAETVLLATPPAAVARLTARLDADLAALAARIRPASVVTVALGFARSAVRHPLKGTGFVVPRREGLQVRAVSWVSSKWGGRAPAGRVLLRAFLGGALHPQAIDFDDDRLIDGVLADVGGLLHVVDAPELVRIYRWRDATPQLEVGHLDLMGAIECRLIANHGLFLSASGFRGTGIADCVADGRRQAARAAAHLAQRAA